MGTGNIMDTCIPVNSYSTLEVCPNYNFDGIIRNGLCDKY